MRRRFVKGGPVVETGTERCIPADVVPPSHLVLEEPAEKQALCARRFHHEPVVQQRRVDDEMIEHRAERGGCGKFLIRLGRYQGVVREHTRVVQQFFAFDFRPRDVLQA